jgi:hypothetical protein
MIGAQPFADAETALFEEWRSVSPNMVTDGVVNPTSYCKQPNRVLLILKEVNSPGAGGWDLREYLRTGGREHTWNNVTRWLAAINNLPGATDWNEIIKITEEDRRAALSGLAAMNLKKVPGGHTAVPEQVANAAKDNTERLRRQFDLYQPHLTICCGVGDLAYGVLFGSSGPGWQQTTRGIRYCEVEPNRFMIAYSHPEARVHAPLLIYGLVDAVKEIRSLHPKAA